MFGGRISVRAAVVASSQTTCNHDQRYVLPAESPCPSGFKDAFTIPVCCPDPWRFGVASRQGKLNGRAFGYSRADSGGREKMGLPA
jgi:hypothetical protein